MADAEAAVLIAEDSQLLLALLKDALLAHAVGAKVEAYGDAARFYAAYRALLAEKRVARLLVVDINLPGEDGLSLGRRVRELERSSLVRPAPLVFFSSRDEDEEVTQAVADCFPARFVQKLGAEGPARVALEGARLMRKMVKPGG